MAASCSQWEGACNVFAIVAVDSFSLCTQRSHFVVTGSCLTPTGLASSERGICS